MVARLDGRSTDRLIRLVRTDADPFVRRMAAYALGNIGTPRTTRVLRDVLRDPDQPAAVRGMAAEQLVYKRAGIPELLAGLRDASPHVRFWSAYALSESRVKRALPELRRLAATDRRRIRGWWSIAREARWAMAVIEAGWTREAPDPMKPVKARGASGRR